MGRFLKPAKVVKFVPLTTWQRAALDSPYTFTAMFGGIASLKTATASHFIIKQVLERPTLTGFIGSNSYDQLNQTFLREVFKWFNQYGIQYVVDCMPPKEWNVAREFKSYKNILTIRNPWTGATTTAFTRVLSEPDNYRGLTLSWAVLDETRDTLEYAFDILLSRLRESDYMKILITTTTNGEDWVYKRFVKNADHKNYGSMHIPTIESVNVGIIRKEFYEALRASYSEMMAAQELDAKHVNIFGGKAYYAASGKNALRHAPWGDNFPTRDRNLIVGCDFNFSPAPCAWIVGQIGPDEYGPNGEYWGECIHWFKEISGVGVSTPEMTLRLLAQFPGYFYEVYGDMSGNIGTTSNAGKTDFDQIGIELSNAEAIYTISVEQMDESEAHINPRVRSRVENMNSLFLNAVGEVRQTYDPEGCPLFDGDIRMVGWKPTTQSGRGRLDDGGDKQRTHATDASGYACFRKFPPGRRASIVESLPSRVREDL